MKISFQSLEQKQISVCTTCMYKATLPCVIPEHIWIVSIFLLKSGNESFKVYCMLFQTTSPSPKYGRTSFAPWRKVWNIHFSPAVLPHFLHLASCSHSRYMKHRFISMFLLMFITNSLCVRSITTYCAWICFSRICYNVAIARSIYQIVPRFEHNVPLQYNIEDG